MTTNEDAEYAKALFQRANPPAGVDDQDDTHEPDDLRDFVRALFRDND